LGASSRKDNIKLRFAECAAVFTAIAGLCGKQLLADDANLLLDMRVLFEGFGLRVGANCREPFKFYQCR
jgi:hypothetical protein